MQQPLCHLYFLTVLEHLMAKQNSESFLHHQHSHMAGLVRMADSIHNSLQTAVGGEAVLLWVELQAVTQVLLQQLALHLDPNQTQMLGDVQQIADDVNRYVSFIFYKSDSTYIAIISIKGFVVFSVLL